MKKGFISVSAALLLLSGVAFGGDATLPENIDVSAAGSSLSQPRFVTVAAAEAPAIQQPVAPATAAPSGPAAGTANPPDQPTAPVPPLPQPAGTEAPLGQTKGGAGITGDVFDRKSNIVHPFLAVGGFFTDNVNNSHDNRKSDMGFIVSPGIYFAVPGIRERIVPVSTLNIAPGGATLTGFRPQYPRTIQSYLYYRADVETFANTSALNDISHLAEGVLQYNMRGGLELELSDQFNLTHNQRGTGFSFGLDRYYANLIGFTAKYEIGDKSLVRVDVSNYYLSFLNQQDNGFRDRYDNRGALYFFYKFWPRTSLFVEYEYLNTTYKQDTVSNSMEHHFFGGIRWDVTDKTRGMLKVGYGVKEFQRSSAGTASNIYAEAQLDHKFTAKTSILLSATRRTDETDVAPSSYIEATSGKVTLLHRFTTKITGNLNGEYTDEKYHGAVTVGSETKELHDQYIRAGASALYEYRDWLNFTLGYYFTDRISNFNSLSYINNTVFFRISFVY